LAAGLAVVAWDARRRGGVRTFVLGTLAVLAIIAALGVAGLAPPRLDREGLAESGKSRRGRPEDWSGAWHAINASPRGVWSGYGPGNFTAAYLKHKLPQSSEEISDPHNLLLDAWATGGAWAALALLTALGFGFWNLFGPAASVVPHPGQASSKEPDAPPQRT